MRTRMVIIAAIIALPCRGAMGGDVSVSASIEPDVVGVGEQARLTVTVEGSFRSSGEPELPALPDLEIYQSGTSRNISFVNGRISSSLSYNYILVPKKKGTYTVGPIKVKIGDKEYQAAPLRLEVTEAPSAIPPPAPSGRKPRGASRRAAEGKSIFITASVDRDTVYVNQQVTWTLYFYMDGRVDLVRTPTFNPPQAEGFWSEDLPPIRKYYQTLDGRRYFVNELKRGYFPTASGTYAIGPAQVTVTIEDLGIPSWDDFFDRSFGSFGFGKPVDLYTEEKKIVVLPLPEVGKPDNFTGLVGSKLDVAVRADKERASVGEPINLTIELRGEGNMKGASLPEFRAPSGFKVYKSGSSEETSRDNYVVTGKKRYEYVLVPRVEGKKTIPALRLSYFDPTERRYEVASSQPIVLDIEPGKPEEGREIIIAGGGTDIEILGRDISYIHPVPSAITLGSRSLYENRLFLGAHAIPLLALLVCIATQRRRRRLKEDTALSRSIRAHGDAEKRLKQAAKLAGKGAHEEALGVIVSAVSGYLADKMNGSPAGLTWPEMEEFLVEKNVEDEIIRRTRQIIDAIDAARFGGGGVSPQAVEDLRRRAMELVRELERRFQR